MIAVFYTGDHRHNMEITLQNHERLLSRLRAIAPVNVYWFTRNDPQRGICPYDPPPGYPDPDNNYRRGQGGAVQVWDFMRGVERTQEPYLLRLRTDVWFTDSSIDIICREVKEVINNDYGIAFFGSDWVNQTAGTVDMKLEVQVNYEPHVQDFAIFARRDSLKSFNDVIEHLNILAPNKRRSGNKTFRYIVPQKLIGPGVQEQTVATYRILCQIWLVRQDYNEYPNDMHVCKDYIQSYIFDAKAKAGKKNLIVPHPMQDAVNWWRNQFGWPPKDIVIDDWYDWQTL